MASPGVPSSIASQISKLSDNLSLFSTCPANRDFHGYLMVGEEYGRFSSHTMPQGLSMFLTKLRYSRKLKMSRKVQRDQLEPITRQCPPIQPTNDISRWNADEVRFCVLPTTWVGSILCTGRKLLLESWLGVPIS